ncbi:internalin N-terminal domain-containing protein [Listeria ivanovii]|uniref:internalin N-terminal domain-containing protein n=1 Tax=Listeria ivanovii TaxID=1638 RepID=UPI0028154911|nr:internalin N-terminal domain-containing protein [Listeria ivanovii]
MNAIHGTKVEAAHITQPMPINQILPDTTLAEVMKKVGMMQKRVEKNETLA